MSVLVEKQVQIADHRARRLEQLAPRFRNGSEAHLRTAATRYLFRKPVR